MQHQLTSDYYVNQLAKDSSVQAAMLHAQNFQQYFVQRLLSTSYLYTEGLRKMDSVKIGRANRALVDTMLDTALLPYRAGLRLWQQ